MATVGEIIDFVDKIYPKSINVAGEVVIPILNDIHNDVHLELAKFKKNPQLGVIQLGSSLPHIISLVDTNVVIKDKMFLAKNNENCLLSSDEKIKLVEFGEFYYDDKYYYNITSESSITILKNGECATDLLDKGYTHAKYIYYPNPNTLDDLNDIPNLDSKYHDLLKFKLIQRLASMGENPDADVANYWDAEYKELLQKVKEHSETDKTNNPISESTTVIDVYGGMV